jgi:hypothetical protein
MLTLKLSYEVRVFQQKNVPFEGPRSLQLHYSSGGHVLYCIYLVDYQSTNPSNFFPTFRPHLLMFEPTNPVSVQTSGVS